MMQIKKAENEQYVSARRGVDLPEERHDLLKAREDDGDDRAGSGEDDTHDSTRDALAALGRRRLGGRHEALPVVVVGARALVIDVVALADAR
jgi:hypothetical protein